MKNWQITILVLVCLFLLICVTECMHQNELESDGFRIIKKYDTYTLVEKEGHQYIATSVGTYGMHWNYEHYPNCPCFKTKE